ncbi:MarR family winged helix-turn-helix transcriptional regulator [Pararhodobacter sp.]|jgi:DNA-binding MarR family transcriptional regulator|uniref:MarR family winged helix-turn-helix transcriptional regulator n=1 Tax=Pararhodobacter sp. TaxID=2127056 RepID=UPI002FDF03B2
MPDPDLPALLYDKHSPPVFEELDYGILHDFIGQHLRVAYEVAYADFKLRLGDEALKPGYFTILTLIVRNPRITQTQIALASERDKSNVTNALRWMEDNALIVRHLSFNDRRTHMCTATQAGIELQARIERKAAAHVQALNDAISPLSRADFARTLKQMIAALQPQAPE